MGEWRAKAVRLTLPLADTYNPHAHQPERQETYSTMVELRKNKAKQTLNEGGIATIAMGNMSGDIIEFLGPLGFDGMWIEAEHGPFDFQDIPNLTRACDLWGLTSVVRLHLNLQGLIYRTLDLGAQAIVVPHVNTAEEAQNVVDGGKFHPIGKRGMATSRQGIGVDNYYPKANDETMLIVLIEDIVAIENIEEIVKVDGIDVFFIANGDLSQSMGLLGQYRHPDVLAAADRGYEAILGAGKHGGALVSDDNLDYYLERNIRFLSTQWTQWVGPSAKSFLDRIEKAS